MVKSTGSFCSTPDNSVAVLMRKHKLEKKIIEKKIFFLSQMKTYMKTTRNRLLFQIKQMITV